VCAMSERILLIDMGNSSLKWLWAVDGEIDEPTFGRGSREDFLSQCCVTGNIQPDRVLLASVANRENTARIVSDCEGKWGAPVKRLESLSVQAGIVNAYETPAALGVDRWLAIVGAAHAHGLPVVIMDLGTATTLDAVDDQGRHMGGLIFTGPALMLNALASATAMQVPTGLADTEKANGLGIGPAQSTSGAISEGVVAAQIGALKQFLRHVSAKLPTEPKLVLTGGAAKGILQRLDNNPVFDPWLVFKGMLHDQE